MEKLSGGELRSEDRGVEVAGGISTHRAAYAESAAEARSEPRLLGAQTRIGWCRAQLRQKPRRPPGAKQEQLSAQARSRDPGKSPGGSRDPREWPPLAVGERGEDQGPCQMRMRPGLQARHDQEPTRTAPYSRSSQGQRTAGEWTGHQQHRVSGAGAALVSSPARKPPPSLRG
jgi:hypothetical protein